VGRLAEAEIFVTDEAHGRRSRVEDGAFSRPKAGRVLVEGRATENSCSNGLNGINGLIPTVSIKI
jgi:hypothetical protein